MDSWLKYLTGQQVLEEGTELAGMTDSVLGFYGLLKEFLGELRGLSIMEIIRSMHAIACLQRVFGPLSVPVGPVIWFLHFPGYQGTVSLVLVVFHGHGPLFHICCSFKTTLLFLLELQTFISKSEVQGHVDMYAVSCWCGR
jgi:hypothetical protein